MITGQNAGGSGGDRDGNRHGSVADPGPAFELQVRYTEPLLRLAARRFLRRFLGREALLVAAGLVLAPALWFGAGVREWYVLALGGGALILGSLLLLIGALYSGRALRRF